METKPLTVSALTKYIKYKFDHDTHLQRVLLEGEISNFKHNARGHFYFTLKDQVASISAVMFRSRAQHVPFQPQEGMSVVVQGNISVFESAGSYQIYVEQMQEKGLGNLYQEYLRLKKELADQGYFAAERKQTLPEFPKQIAIITSDTGAVIRDMITTLNHRYPLVKVLLYPTVVQGEHAAPSIVKNIQLADANASNDVIIVGRGGGSIEDLWAFNERIVAEAIYHAKTPIISAVGHETDYTIADEVADLRAPTPTAAAQMAVPDQRIIKARLQEDRVGIQQALKRLLHYGETRLNNLRHRPWVRQPERLLMPYERRMEQLTARLQARSPKHQLMRSHDQLMSLNRQLQRMYEYYLDQKTQRLSRLQQTLTYQNPYTLLNQGYALLQKDGQTITSIEDLKLGDVLNVQLKDGTITSRIEALEKKGEDDE